ncbi:helix-turn-helix domain-containing protein [Roseivivax sp. CAU 1761]
MTATALPHHVGDDIRALRKGRGITLSRLSGAVGRSVGWLSQVERGQTTPSVDDLGRLAEELGVNISFFFRSARRAPEERGVVLRRADRTPIGSEETGLTEELLSPALDGSFEMIRSTFAPRSAGAGLRRSRGTENGGVLIEGRLVLILGAQELQLETGDSFQFRNRDYGWRNEGDAAARVLWVVAPPIY